MLAFLVAGVILGVLARVLHHDSDDVGILGTLLIGVVASVVGGCGMNLLLGDDLVELTAWSFAMACVLSFATLGLLEAGIGRRR